MFPKFLGRFLLLTLAVFVLLGAGKRPPTSEWKGLKVTDLTGRQHSLKPSGSPISVFVFLATECPASNRYAPRVRRLADTYARRGIRFFGIYPNAYESEEAIRQHAAEYGYSFPLVHNEKLARHLGATVTPQIVIRDTRGNVCYRGRLDDNDDATRVRSRFAEAALKALLAGRSPAIRETRATGCSIRTTPQAQTNRPARVNYARHVAPLLQQHCLPCHRKGEVGPFPLETYEQARAWAAPIRDFTRSRRMPPWKAASHGEFHDENRLTTTEIATLGLWADDGAPSGDLRTLPPPVPLAPTTGWTLGEPDAIIAMPQPFAVAAEGKDLYRCFVLSTDFDEERWVSGVEYQPGNRSVVHHVSVFVDTSGAARKLAVADRTGQPGYTNPTPGNGPGFSTYSGQLGGWTPGHQPRLLPPGVAIPLPKGADIVLEVHYHPSGKVEKDQTRFGLRFSREPVRKRLRLGDVSNATFRIPPGAPNHTVEAYGFTPGDITLLSVTPHLHNIGKAMKVSALLPDGTSRLLVDVPEWDFRWQPSYRFKTPVQLPRGTRIDVTARFDNSEKNPNNPHHPPRTVVWGEGTDDEMCTAFFAYTLDDEDLRNESVIVPVSGN